MASIKDFSIRKTIIQSYPDIVLKQGIDFDKNGIIEEGEMLIDENENGKFDEEEYWNFFQDYRELISKKVVQKVEAVKDVAKSGIEGECYGDTACVTTCLKILGAMKDKSNIPTFLKELGNYDGEVRQAAVGALGNTGDKSVVGMLLEVMKTDERPRTAAAAVTALSKICSNEDREVVVAIRMALSDDKRSMVKYRCAQALAKIGDATAIPELKVALQSKNDNVRRGAAMALGNIGNASVVSDLIAALRDESAKVRRNAAGALGKLGDVSAKSALEEAVKDIDPEVGQVAARALANINEIIKQEELKKAEEAKKLAEQKKAAETKKASEAAKPKSGCGCTFVY